MCRVLFSSSLKPKPILSNDKNSKTVEKSPPCSWLVDHIVWQQNNAKFPLESLANCDNCATLLLSPNVHFNCSKCFPFDDFKLDLWHAVHYFTVFFSVLFAEFLYQLFQVQWQFDHFSLFISVTQMASVHQLVVILMVPFFGRQIDCFFLKMLNTPITVFWFA